MEARQGQVEATTTAATWVITGWVMVFGLLVSGKRARAHGGFGSVNELVMSWFGLYWQRRGSRWLFGAKVRDWFCLGVLKGCGEVKGTT
ncbi:hypothetical protein M0R45_026090 [Rubus argutus]|uniref:Uncharacterized protein n=1 Tax=Rubus argutus TaxID=59490 RepID=A0AAW1WYT6_RUBAR